MSNPDQPETHSHDTRLRRRISELSDSFAQSEEGKNVSDFWRRLVSKHLDLLGREGFAHFKQTLNFEYSQWCVTAPIDRKFWHMLYSQTRRYGAPKLFRHASYSPGARLPRWPIPSPGASQIYKTFVCTLWEYAQREDDLGILERVEEAPLGEPIPIYHAGRLISQDLALCALEINRAARHIELGKIKTVLEIGGGYGRWAYVLKKLLPDVEYHIVDIPPTLAVSELYLTTLFGAKNLHFHLPNGLRTLPARHFDLVVNVSSFDEMKASQAEDYLAAFAEKGRGVAYLKGHKYRKPGTGRRGIFELSTPGAWQELYRGGDPFQMTFGERVFKV
jgi:putative sugar O-methyltransferase